MQRKIFTLSIFALYLVLNTVQVNGQGVWVQPLQDTYTYLNEATGEGGDDNYGAEWRMRIRSDYLDNGGTNMYTRHAYLQFSLDGTDVLFKEDVKQAYLQLTINRWYNQRSGYHGQFRIYDMGTNQWDEMTLTYNNSPWDKSNPGDPIADTEDTYGYINQIGSTDPVEVLVIDITKYVWSQLDIGNTTFSIVIADLTSNTEFGNGTDGRFYSKEATAADEKSPDSTYFPYLVLNENPQFKGYARVPVKEDCYVDGASSNVDNNYNDWRVRMRASSSNKRSTFLKFSLEGTNYLYSTDVEEAYLSLTAERLLGTNGFDYFQAWDVGDNSWSEETMTWNTAPWNKDMAVGVDPVFSSDSLKGVLSADPVFQVWIKITDYIKAQLDSGNTTFTLALSDTSYGEAWNNGTDARFYSKDCLTDPGAPTDWWKMPQESFIPAIYLKPDLPTAIDDENRIQPKSFTLTQNFPNPFNPSTEISFAIPVNGKVTVSIYNVVGQKVRTLLNENQSAGPAQLTWNGENDAGVDVPSGIYFTRVNFDNESKIIKMVLTR